MALLPFRVYPQGPPPSVSSVPWDIADQVGSGLHCGEDIHPGAPCYIGPDQLVYMSGGSGVTSLSQAGAAVDGYATEAAKFAQNDPVTLVIDLDWGLFDKEDGNVPVTPGIPMYVHYATSAKGMFDTAPTFPGQRPCGKVETRGRARLFRPADSGGVANAVVGRVLNEVPSGTVDGARTVFGIAHSPDSAGVAVYMGASATAMGRVAPTAYILDPVAKTITFSVAPAAGWKLYVDYNY